MASKQDAVVDDIVREFDQVSSDRGTWEAHWREIAERILPSHTTAFEMNGEFQTPGEKRTEKIFDSTGAIALNRFASILDSLLTPRNQKWHRLTTSSTSLNKNRRVRLWFEEVTDLLFKYRYAPKANFSSQNQQNYKSLGAFGTGCVFTDALKDEPGVRYKAIHLSQVYFVENHQGVIDRALRAFWYTARQAYEKWGDALPEQIISVAKGPNPAQRFRFLHCVKPRLDRNPRRLDSLSLPWSSHYISLQHRKLVKEGGYNSLPYSVSRYEQAPGEEYGRSPAMDVLPAIKTLNEEKKTVLKQGHRVVDPVLLTHDDGIVDTFSLKPGAINAGGVSAEGRALVHALPVGNIAIGKDMMDDERQIINDAFLVTLFQILVETPQMTATEVMERTREKGILLAPTVGRQQSEYLGPLIEREIDVLIQQGLLPAPPPELVEARGEYRIEYDSPMSRAQRAEEAAGFMRTIETALQVAQVTQDQSPLDHFDMDEIVPELSDINGMPVRWRRTMQKIEEIRQQRAQQQMMETAIRAAPGVAAVTKAGAVVGKANA